MSSIQSLGEYHLTKSSSKQPGLAAWEEGNEGRERRKKEKGREGGREGGRKGEGGGEQRKEGERGRERGTNTSSCNQPAAGKEGEVRREERGGERGKGGRGGRHLEGLHVRDEGGALHLCSDLCGFFSGTKTSKDLLLFP